MTQKTSTPGPSGTSEPKGGGAAADLQQSITSGAHDISSEVKHLAGDVAGQAKKTAETALATQKDAAAQGVRSVAEALRHTSDHLRTQNKGALPGYVNQAADRVEQVSGYLQSRTLGQVIGDVEDFARREPALFLGGAFVAGLVGGRFLKSTSRMEDGRRREARTGRGSGADHPTDRSSAQPAAKRPGAGMSNDKNRGTS